MERKIDRFAENSIPNLGINLQWDSFLPTDWVKTASYSTDHCNDLFKTTFNLFQSCRLKIALGNLA